MTGVSKNEERLGPNERQDPGTKTFNEIFNPRSLSNCVHIHKNLRSMGWCDY